MEKSNGRKFVELEWVCPNCESRNKGSKKTCENCGAPQPDNVKFQRALDEKIVTDEKALEVAKAGADIHCGFCGTRNAGNAITCSQCGGDLKEGKKREAGQVLQAAPPPPKAIYCGNCATENLGSARTCKQCGAVLRQETSASVQTPKAAVAVPANKFNWLVIGGISALFLLCCIVGLVLFAIPSKSVKGTVINLEWQTSVAVQEMQPVNYFSERGSPPSDAYNVSCHTDRQEVCEEKTVDQGNGFAEVIKECHIEDEQYCDYTLDEWTTVQSYELSGSDNHPVYAETRVANDQRAANAIKALNVTFSTSEGQKIYNPDTISEFERYEIGSVWTLNMNAMGGVMSVER